MPNWCNNTMIISHDDPAMIKKACDAWNSGEFLQAMIPCPQPLLDTVSGYVGSVGDDPLISYKAELHEAQQNLNLKYFGHKNWYDWKVANWGTKWDVGAEGNETVDLDGNTFGVGFCSAWSPPTSAYEKLAEMGFHIKAYYYEPGEGFCGRWEDGAEEFIEIGTIEQARLEIPRDIDQEMGIIDSMEEWEEHDA